MQSPTWIAELRVVLVYPDGRHIPGHIAVGHPYTPAGSDPAASHAEMLAMTFTLVDERLGLEVEEAFVLLDRRLEEYARERGTQPSAPDDGKADLGADDDAAK